MILSLLYLLMWFRQFVLHSYLHQSCKGPSVKDVRTKSRKFDPSPRICADTP